MLVLGLDRGGLDGLFAFDGVGRERGVEQHVGEDIQAQPQIGLHHFHRYAEAVVPAVAADAAADGLDLLRELRRRPALGALEEHACEQLGQAIVSRVFHEQTAAENGVEVHQRQPRVFAHEQPQAVGQLKLLDFPGAVQLNALLRLFARVCPAGRGWRRCN